MCAIVGVMAFMCLPQLDAHVAKAQGQQFTFAMQQVWADPNHRRALWMSAAMMFAGFTIIPYITIYTQANQVLTLDEIPYIYLCGGTVTLLTARWIGRLSDRVGKRKMFQRMLLLAIVPMTITTLMQPAPLPLVLMVFAGFFLHECADDPWHGHADFGSSTPVAGHIHVSERSFSVCFHWAGVMAWRGAYSARCQRSRHPLLALRLGGHGLNLAGVMAFSACGNAHRT